MQSASRNGISQIVVESSVPTLLPSVDLDPKDVLPAPGNALVTLEGITASGLLASISERGQLVEGIVYTAPELPPGKFYNADGNGRALCALVLGRKFKARLLDHAPTKAELRRIRVATSLIRKDKSAAQAQLAADLLEEMEETGHTQEQAAADLGISAPHACKVLAPLKRLCPDLQHLRDSKAICWDGLRIIATMPTEELQKKLADRAQATIASGGKVKRDLMERWAKEMKGGNLPRKPKPIRVRHSGIAATIQGNVVQEWKAFRAAMDEAIKKLERDGLRPEILPDLLK